MKVNQDGTISVLDIFRTDPTPAETALGSTLLDVAKGKVVKGGGKSLRELIADNLEKSQRTKSRRDPLLDRIIKELRLN